MMIVLVQHTHMHIQHTHIIKQTQTERHTGLPKERRIGDSYERVTKVEKRQLCIKIGQGRLYPGLSIPFSIKIWVLWENHV